MYRILVIEDDSIQQKVVRDILKRERCDVVIAPDGASGLKAAAAEKPDLIILDINLPDMTGMEVCKGLKADPAAKHIPVIMLTGEAREVTQRVEGLDLGAEDYLFKPISPKVLVSRIQQVLRIGTKPSNQ